MKFIYEKGDKVVVLATGAHARVIGVQGRLTAKDSLRNVVMLDDGTEHDVAEAHTKFRPVFAEQLGQVAIVVREGETGDGGVVRVLIVPKAIVDENFRHAVADLYEYGNQNVDYVEPDACVDLAAVESVFNAMNPPRVDEDDITCDDCGKPMVLNMDGTTNHLIEGSEGVDSIDHDTDADHAAINEMMEHE